MAHWTDTRTTDAAVRAAGALCCAASYLSIGALANLRHAVPPVQPGGIAYALAAIAFVGGSLGTALLVLGRHIFDRIEVSSRWHYRSIDKMTTASPDYLSEPAAGVDEKFLDAQGDLLLTAQGIIAINELPRTWPASETQPPMPLSLRVAS